MFKMEKEIFKMKRIDLLIRFVIIAIVSLILTDSFGATKTSAGSGSWSNAATWSPSGVPANGDDVIIAGNYTVTISSAVTCRNLTIGSNTNKDAYLNLSGASAALTITGDLQLNPFIKSKSFIIDVAQGTVNVNGTLSVWNTSGAGLSGFTISTGALSLTPSITLTTDKQLLDLSGGGTVTFNSSFSDQAAALTVASGCNINIYSSYTVSSINMDWTGLGTLNMYNGSSVTATSNLTLNDVVVQNSSSATISNSAGSFIVGGNVTLNTSSTLTLSRSIQINGNWTNNGGTLSGGSNTITFNSSSGSITGSSSTTFPNVQIGLAGAVASAAYSVNTSSGCSNLVLDGNSVARTLTIASGKTFTISGSVTLNQPTGASVTNMIDVGAGSCSVAGNLVFAGTSTDVTRMAKVNVSTGSFSCTGTVTWMSNTVSETEVFAITSTGSITFGSSVTMGSASGTINMSGAGTINFNGTTAPSLNYGGATTPVFTTASGSTIAFAKGFTNGTNAFSFNTASTVNFTGTGTFTPSAAVTFGNIGIGSGATLTLAGNVTLAGNWYNEGTLTPSTYFLTFNSGATQTIQRTSSGETLYGLSVSNTGTTLVMLSDVSVSNSANVAASTTLNDSIYILSGAGSMTMASGATWKLRRSSSGTFPELTGSYSLGAGSTMEFYQISGTGQLRAVSYENVLLSGSSAFDLSLVSNVNGNLTVGGSASLTSMNGLTVGGLFTTSTSATYSLPGSLTTNGFLISAGSFSDNDKSIVINGALGWENNGGTFTSTGRVIFNGSVAQQIKGTQSSKFHTLEINNASGLTVNVSSGMFAIVSDSLVLTNGVLYSSSTKMLKMLDAAISVGVKSSSYVSGPMVKVGNTDFIFPLGDAGKVGKIGISALSTATTEVTGEYYASAYASLTPVSVDMVGVSDKEYWMIDRTGSSDAVKIRLFWTSPTNVIDCDNLRLAHYKGGQWQIEPAMVVDGSICQNNGSGSIETISGVSSFSPFTFGDAGGALPVELVSFTAKAEGELVNTNWATALEINNAYFTVERSSNGVDFEEVARVDGAGNSTRLLNYNFTDQNPVSGLSYYRLRQTDYDGANTVSDMVSVTVTSKASVSVFPNPSNGNISINASGVGEKATLEVYNVSGGLVYQQDLEFRGGNRYNLSLQGILQPGIYLMTIAGNLIDHKEKVIIQ